MNELVVLQDSTVGTGLETWKLQGLGSDGQVGCTQLTRETVDQLGHVSAILLSHPIFIAIIAHLGHKYGHTFGDTLW